jgi:hypothetical protein
MDNIERLAQQAAEAINGGEFYDGKWYTEGQRQAWRKAMTPAADEIERLRKDKAELLKALTNLYESCRWEKVCPTIDAAKDAVAKATGGE